VVTFSYAIDSPVVAWCVETALHPHFLRGAGPSRVRVAGSYLRSIRLSRARIRLSRIRVAPDSHLPTLLAVVPSRFANSCCVNPPVAYFGWLRNLTRISPTRGGIDLRRLRILPPFQLSIVIVGAHHRVEVTLPKAGIAQI
jgi:hypothetical protein